MQLLRQPYPFHLTPRSRLLLELLIMVALLMPRWGYASTGHVDLAPLLVHVSTFRPSLASFMPVETEAPPFDVPQ